MNMPFIRKKLLAIAAFMAMAAAPYATHAALINTAIVPGINEIEDTDAERIIRNGGIVTSGAVQVGDVFQTALRWNTVNGTQIFAIPGLAPPYQLTAYAELRVASITPTACAPGTPAGQPCGTITFGPTGALGAGVLAAIYENPAGTLTSFGQNPATTIAKAQSGSLVFSAGLVDPQDFWIAPGSPLNIGFVSTLPPGSPQAPVGVFGLSVVANPGGVPITPDALLSPVSGAFHDIVGNASAFQRGPGVNGGWAFATNTTIDFLSSAVPEPGSLALVGLTLTVAGFRARRHGQRKQASFA